MSFSFGQSQGMGFVQRPQSMQPRRSFGIAAQPQPGFHHRIANIVEALWRQPVRPAARQPFSLALLQMKDVAKVDQRMPRHRKRQLRLARRDSRDHRDQQCAAVEHGRDRR